MRPWDLTNDKLQYESDYIITTWTKHRTPVVRTLSITSLEQKPETGKPVTVIPATRHSSRQLQRPTINKRLNIVGEESGSSTGEIDARHDSDSSEPNLSKYIVTSINKIKYCGRREWQFYW